MALTVSPSENLPDTAEPDHDAISNTNASGKNLVRNALAGYISTFVNMAIGFLVTPFLVRRLGVDAFGTWTLLFGMMGYLGLIEFGVGTATIKRVAECRATGDRKRLETVLGSAFALYLLFTCIALVTGILLLEFALPHLRIPQDERYFANWVFGLLVISQSVVFLFYTRSLILTGSGRSDLMALPGTVITALIALAQCAVVYFHLSIIGLGVVALFSTLINSLLGQWIIARQFPEIRVRLRASTPAMIRELAKFGARNGIINLSLTLGFATDTVIIGAMLPVSAVTSYAIPAKLMNLMKTIAVKPVDVLLPAYAHFHAINDRKRQFQIYIESTMLCLCLALPFAIVLCFFGDGIITLWVGPGHRDSYPILIVLSLLIAVSIPSATGFAILTAKEKNTILIAISICVSMANFAMSILFTRWYGAIGPALGSLMVVGIPDFFIIPIFVCGVLGYRYRDYVSEIWLTLLAPIAACILAAAALRWRFGAPAGFFLLFEMLVTLSVFYTVWARFGLSAEKRGAYTDRIRGLIRKRIA